MREPAVDESGQVISRPLKRTFKYRTPMAHDHEIQDATLLLLVLPRYLSPLTDESYDAA